MSVGAQSQLWLGLVVTENSGAGFCETSGPQTVGTRGLGAQTGFPKSLGPCSEVCKRKGLSSFTTCTCH